MQVLQLIRFRLLNKNSWSWPFKWSEDSVQDSHKKDSFIFFNSKTSQWKEGSRFYSSAITLHMYNPITSIFKKRSCLVMPNSTFFPHCSVVLGACWCSQPSGACRCQPVYSDIQCQPVHTNCQWPVISSVDCARCSPPGVDCGWCLLVPSNAHKYSFNISPATAGC